MRNNVCKLKTYRITQLEAEIVFLRQVLTALVGDLAMHSNLPPHIRDIIQEVLQRKERK